MKIFVFEIIIKDFQSSNASIVEEWNNHKKVAKISSGGHLEFNYSENISYELISLFFAFTSIDSNHDAVIRLRNNNDLALEIKFTGGLIKYFDGVDYKAVGSYSSVHFGYYITEFHPTAISLTTNGKQLPSILVLNGLTEINTIYIQANGADAYVDPVGLKSLNFVNYSNMASGISQMEGIVAQSGLIKSLVSKNFIVNGRGNYKLAPAVLGKSWSYYNFDSNGIYNIPANFEYWQISAAFTQAQLQFMKDNHRYVMYLQRNDSNTASLDMDLLNADIANYAFSTWLFPLLNSGGKIEFALRDDVNDYFTVSINHRATVFF